ncbi:hypothetical protein [Vibrio harveyi]|uniref:hypothetical protein n=1 Tax=Vibrio harveyi TaxID=669 RepID=UPI0023809C57|nr:hypothetical protein [Vibrio harveyi]
MNNKVKDYLDKNFDAESTLIHLQNEFDKKLNEHTVNVGFNPNDIYNRKGQPSNVTLEDLETDVMLLNDSIPEFRPDGHFEATSKNVRSWEKICLLDEAYDIAYEEYRVDIRCKPEEEHLKMLVADITLNPDSIVKAENKQTGEIYVLTPTVAVRLGDNPKIQNIVKFAIENGFQDTPKFEKNFDVYAFKELDKNTLKALREPCIPCYDSNYDIEIKSIAEVKNEHLLDDMVKITNSPNELDQDLIGKFTEKALNRNSLGRLKNAAKMLTASCMNTEVFVPIKATYKGVGCVAFKENLENSEKYSIIETNSIKCMRKNGTKIQITEERLDSIRITPKPEPMPEPDPDNNNPRNRRGRKPR